MFCVCGRIFCESLVRFPTLVERSKSLPRLRLWMVRQCSGVRGVGVSCGVEAWQLGTAHVTHSVPLQLFAWFCIDEYDLRDGLEWTRFSQAHSLTDKKNKRNLARRTL